ncbi:glucosaminidase domain-containing protein [Parasediminibacterium paludis]|uniref:Peptidoglycan hydrolase n=1 Tax=Parasediminibacterium paludis TaxID=908966 RepID=A0ABV8PZ55_9BACT
MKQCLTIFLATLMLASNAQKEKAYNYIAQYKDIAIAEMQRSGVPASITLAQGILESSYGESDLCKNSNNHFGIKCKTEWNGDKVYHDDDTKQECFRSYPSAAESYKDHSNFLRTRTWYDFLFKLDPTDYVSWAKGLKKAGYATEKDYPQKLIKVINDYNLNQYTLIALNKLPNDNQTLANTAKEEIYEDTTMAPELVITISSKQLRENQLKRAQGLPEDSVIIINPNVTVAKPSVEKKTANYPEGIFTINHSKVIYAKEGTSLLSLAKQYDISLAKLLEFNDMEDEEILATDKLIFIEKKLTKGATDFHTVKPNETLHDICQTEGVRLDKLAEYNGIKKNMQPVIGEKIYLRTNAPIVPKTMAQTNAQGGSLSTN